MRKPELLIPASSLEVLKTAVIFGADAGLYRRRGVWPARQSEEFYAGGDGGRDRFCPCPRRAGACDGQYPGAQPGSGRGAGIFSGIEGAAAGCSDHCGSGVYDIAMEVCPEIERHISTQANNTNYMTYRFWHELGAKRVVCARELSLKEIREIRENIPADMEMESFIHGSMCISYSGRCLLSSFLAGRDANQGGVYSSLPLEVRGDGGKPSRRIFSGLRK